MLLFPNSGTTAELGEVGWTAVARAAAVAARRMKMRTPAPKPSAGGGGSAKSSGGGGGKKSSRPKKGGERQNEQGERVLDYNDGSTVTVHADGSATHTDAKGVQRKGAYKDPVAKPPNTDPEGFSVPKPKAAPKLRHTQKRAAAPKAPRQTHLVRAKLSRTKKGPVAGSGAIYR